MKQTARKEVRVIRLREDVEKDTGALLQRSPAQAQQAATFGIFVLVTTILLVVVMVLGVTIGGVPTPLSAVLHALSQQIFRSAVPSGERSNEPIFTIVWLLRMPRAVMAPLVDAALGVGGAQMQGLFQNPLASPDIIGVSAGGSLGGVVALATGLATRSMFYLPLLSFSGALLALIVVYAIATRRARTKIATLPLAGVAVNALIGAITSFLITVTWVRYEVAQRIIFWLMGGLANRTWAHVWLGVPSFTVGILLALAFARDLDILAASEQVASSLNVEVERSKRVLLVNAALLTGGAVALSRSDRIRGSGRAARGQARDRSGASASASGEYTDRRRVSRFRRSSRANSGSPRRDPGRNHYSVFRRTLLSLSADAADAPGVIRLNELEARWVTVSLSGRKVVREVSVSFETGQLAVVIGPNGAGKTTLLRVLAGLERVDSGVVILQGKDLHRISRRMLARRLSLVPQNTGSPFPFSVREVVATGRNPHLRRFERERQLDSDAIDEALELTDCHELADRAVTELSGAERQRVMIALSLATRAEIILLDEPTANLDPAHAIDVLDLCGRLAAGGKVVILTTQYLPMAERYAERVVLMNSGALSVSGTREEVFTEATISSVFGVSAERAFTSSGDETLLFHRGQRDRLLVPRDEAVREIER
jgi:iron complex transport system permease protein